MKTDVGRIFPLALMALVMALPSCAGRVDLLKKGQEAEKAGKREEALDAYTQAIQAGNLTGE